MKMIVHRRSLPILALALSFAFLLMRCSTTKNSMHTEHMGPGPDLCAGAPNPYAPIVCVDDSRPSLPAYPETVVAVNQVPGKKRTVIQWFTKSGGNELSITFAQSEAHCFVKTPNCEGSHCVAIINPNAVKGSNCKYDIKLLNKAGFKNDPNVEIDNCCPAP